MERMQGAHAQTLGQSDARDVERMSGGHAQQPRPQAGPNEALDSTVRRVGEKTPHAGSDQATRSLEHEGDCTVPTF